MKSLMYTLLWLCLAACCGSAFAEEDTPSGSRDHPLLNRMPGFFINGYTVKDFDAFEFPIGRELDGQPKQTIEGKTYEITYNRQHEAPGVSMLRMLRNYETALRKANATIVAKSRHDSSSSYNFMTAKVAKPDSGYGHC